MALNTSQNNLNTSESVTDNKCSEGHESDTRKKLKSRKKKSSKRSGNATTIVYGPTSPIISHSRKRPRSAIPIVPSMTAYEYYTPSPHEVTYNEWSPILSSIHIPSPIYTMAYTPIPVTIIPPTQVISRSICPFTCTIMRPQILTPVIPVVTEVPSVVITQPFVTEVSSVPSHIYEPVSQYTINETVDDSILPLYEEAYDEVPEEYINDGILQDNVYHGIPEEITYDETIEENLHVDDDITGGQEATSLDPLESYLMLPRDLFPTARMHSIDPNPLIDVFCNVKDLYRHVPWILDLEFGIPRHAVTRPIPMYNVKFFSINCKNVPDAIHPGFESCTNELKSALLFYYDCIVSSWYTGYMILNHDRSVENFQSWLHLPMQMLGMCWP